MDKKNIFTIVGVAGGAYLIYWYLQNYGPSGAVTVAGGAGSYWASWFGTSTGTSTSTAAGTSTSTPVVTSTPILTTNSDPTQSQSTTPPVSTGTSSAQVMATPAQISAIQSLLVTRDLPDFQAMLPTLTYDQAASMLSTAQACAASGTSARPLGYSTSSGGCSVTVTNQSSQLLQASGGVNSLTVSQWNYYMQNGGNGVPPIDPNGSFPALNDGGVAMDVNTYLNLRASNGLSGLGSIVPVAPGITQAITGLSGMGQIMERSPYVSPALNGVRDGAAGLGGLAGGVPAATVARTRSAWGLASRRVN